MSEKTPPTEELDGVAIIGMAGRFPGASDVESLWRNLRAGVCSVATLADDELRAAGVPESLVADPRYVKKWGRIEDADCFDADFFGINPRDAERMDPQQRLFLESAWAALESAGHAAGRRSHRVGVYGGVGFNHYLARHLIPELDESSAAAFYRLFFGNDKDFVCTRVAHALDLTGPAITLQTACSTSLVAVCTAALHLLTHQCDLALAGGASIRVPLAAGYLFEEGGTSSPDGVCRSFDAAARGAVWGSGVGVVALKRLADAVRDGDHVFAVIKGFALNNDGAAKAGFTAPSVDGQAEVIGRALDMAGFDARTIGYVEAHGTGTLLGDPIEVAALVQAFRAAGAGSQRGTCALGSVKTNLGHLDVAAGVTGLIKAALAVDRGEIPASLHFVRPNPHIDFTASPFFVNTALHDWPLTPRRAGVSSFGIGGTNAHLVLEQGPAAANPDTSRAAVLLPVSAKTPAALDRMTQKLVAWLTEHPEANLRDVAYTLQVGRESFVYRRCVVCQTVDEAVRALANAAAAGATVAPSVALVGAALETHARATWQQLGITASASAHADALIVDLDPHTADRGALLALIGRLWCAGVAIRWPTLTAGERRVKVPLPTYCFARDRHWLDRGARESRHTLQVIAWQRTALREGPPAAVLVVSEDGQLEASAEREPAATLLRVWRARGDTMATVSMALAELQLLLKAGRPRDVLWVTERALKVTGEDVPQPELAALWGLGRSVMLEHAPIRLTLIDVDELPAPARLLGGPAAQWALRRGQAFVPRPTPAASDGTGRAAAGAGAVVITGGLGALGMQVAEHLARAHGVAQLVLIGRQLPDAQQRARLARLEATGVTVTIAALDVTNRESLRQALAAQPVRGVVHAAGVLDDGIVERLTPERLARVLEPKVLGARWLDELTRDMALDFFVLFSSVASLGAPGQASYAAANAFLDALAENRRAQGKTAVSIGWGPWAGEGMAAQHTAARPGLRRLDPAAGLALFTAALAQPNPVVYVTAEPEILIPPSPRVTTPVATTGRRRDELLTLVRSEVARLLGAPADSLPMDQSLALLGMDSLMGVELRSVLSTRLGRSVPGRLLFDQPHVEAIATALADLLHDEKSPAPSVPHGITRLHPESPYPSLYLLGGAVGGNELYLRELAEALGYRAPCYGLHYPGMTQDELPLDDVGALADYFVARLRAFQPRGPYALAGHSLGGMIAFEMAIKLQRAGQSVVELILLDAPLFSGTNPLGHERAGLWTQPSLREYVAQLDKLRWLTPDLAAVFAKADTATGWPLLERMWRASVTAMRRYQPTATYDGEATFVTPMMDRDGLAACIPLWRARCPALKVARTSGNHISMVRAPHVHKTAQIIRGLFVEPTLDEL